MNQEKNHTWEIKIDAQITLNEMNQLRKSYVGNITAWPTNKHVKLNETWIHHM